eukprot:gene4605-6786_t
MGCTIILNTHAVDYNGMQLTTMGCTIILNTHAVDYNGMHNYPELQTSLTLFTQQLFPFSCIIILNRNPFPFLHTIQHNYTVISALWCLQLCMLPDCQGLGSGRLVGGLGVDRSPNPHSLHYAVCVCWGLGQSGEVANTDERSVINVARPKDLGDGETTKTDCAQELLVVVSSACW